MKNEKSKQKMILFYFTCICLFMLFLTFSYSAFGKIVTMASQNNITDEKPIIIIDSGHGGEDGGATGVDGTLEKDINLSISNKLKEFFLQGGFEVKTVREEDKSVCDDGLQTVKERKKSDIHNRLDMINSDQRNIAISIHQNKFEQSKYSGTQTFYSPNGDDSKALADCIQKAVVAFLQPDNTRECKKADKNIYLLYNAKVPSVIVECGFLSNEAELNKLKDSDYQNKMAYSIYFGFLQYYNLY